MKAARGILSMSALVAERETFDQFERRTRKDWYRVAEFLLSKYRVPLAVEVSDVVQELLFHAWRYVGAFDPTRSEEPGRFVLFSAISRTKRWLNKQRGAASGRELSRHDVAFCEVFEQEPEVEVEGDQESKAEHELILGRLLEGCRTVQEEICLVAVWRIGDAEAAAIELYRDVDTRMKCRFDCRSDARKGTRRALKNAKERSCLLRS